MENTNINPDNLNHSNQPRKNPNTQKASIPPLFNNDAALPRYKIRTNAFDKIAIILNLVFTFLFIKSVLFTDYSSWTVTAAYLGIFVLATAFIAVKQKTANAQVITTGVLCIAASMSFALRENPIEIQIWVIFMLIYLSGSYCIALTNSNRHGRGSYFFLLDILKTEFLIPILNLFLPCFAMHNTRKVRKQEKGKTDKKVNKKYLAAIIGIICAIPVLLIVVPLLLKSDAAFESVAGSFFEKINHFFSNFDDSFGKISDWLGDNIFYIILTIFVAPFIFSVMFSFRHSVANEENKDTSKHYAKLRFGSPALFSGFLGVICLVYVIYILSQTAYFFSAFGGKLPDGTNITIAEYARRGFFELAGVAAVNLVLIAVTVLFSRRNGKNFNTVIKVFDLFLCAFNILLSAISMSKILLYMNEMGLTHKRIYVFLIDTVMIVAFFCIAARLFNEKFPYMRVITATACVLLTALSLIGVDAIIAKYNAEKYLKGEIECTDIYDLFDGNGIATFESCIKIAKSKTDLQNNAEEVLTKLVNGYCNGSLPDTDWFSPDSNGKYRISVDDYTFNIDAHKALKAVNDNVSAIINAANKRTWFYDIEISVDVDSSNSVKSIGVTVYNEDTNAGNTSVVENADGSNLKNDLYVFSNEYTPGKGGKNNIDFETTDQNGKRYVGTISNISIEFGEYMNLYNIDNDLIISYDGESKRLQMKAVSD